MTDREAMVRRHIDCLQQMIDEKCKELELVRSPLAAGLGSMGAEWGEPARTAFVGAECPHQPGDGV